MRMVDYSITSLHEYPFGDVILTKLRIYRPGHHTPIFKHGVGHKTIMEGLGVL